MGLGTFKRAQHVIGKLPLLTMSTIHTRVTDMGGDNDDKWFVAGRHS